VVKAGNLWEQGWEGGRRRQDNWKKLDDVNDLLLRDGRAEKEKNEKTRREPVKRMMTLGKVAKQIKRGDAVQGQGKRRKDEIGPRSEKTR